MSYTTQNSLLLGGLIKFYKTDNNINKILSIINGENPISLRLIDWFVTNFSKKHYTYYNIVDNKNIITLHESELKECNNIQEVGKILSIYQIDLSNLRDTRDFTPKEFKIKMRGWIRERIQRTFKVYIDYKLKLKAYSKKRFDPFCRWERITIPYGEGTSVQTTIGQLNFFKWVLENNIIDYIKNNTQEIENDMNSRNSSKSNRKKGDGKTRRKRQELSMSATKSIKKENVEVIVTFD